MIDQTFICLLCRKETTYRVNKYDYEEWLHGADDQSALPYLTKAERISLRCKICVDCMEGSNAITRA